MKYKVYLSVLKKEEKSMWPTNVQFIDVFV